MPDPVPDPSSEIVSPAAERRRIRQQYEAAELDDYAATLALLRVDLAERRGRREAGRLARDPFVSPAGCVLDEVLDQVGIDRSTVYVTNAVKQFKSTGTRQAVDSRQA